MLRIIVGLFLLPGSCFYFFSCSGKFQNPILTFSVLKICISWLEHMCVWQGVVICVVYLCVCMECGLCICIVSVVTVCV